MFYQQYKRVQSTQKESITMPLPRNVLLLLNDLSEVLTTHQYKRLTDEIENAIDTYQLSLGQASLYSLCMLIYDKEIVIAKPKPENVIGSK